MSLPRYPAYKDSGVAWLGEVPGHWIITALKRGFDVTLGKMLQPESNSPDDELLPYLRAANIQWSGVETTDIKQMWLSKRDRAQLRLERDDLLVSEGGDVGRSCLWAAEIDECYFQNSVNRVRVRDGNSNHYLYYWMSVIKDKGYIDVLCNKSTIAHFTAEKVVAVPVPFPPPEEQSAIATFLDRETGKIDALVAEQEKLIQLLREKRQAVISHAVTKGINPAATMKDSGIEWLGEVPAHWEVKRLKFLCDVQTGDKDTVNAIEDGQYPFFVRSQTVEHIDSFTFDCEAVLTAGDGVGVGKVYHYVNGKFDFHQRVYMMNNFRYVSGKFFYRYLATLFHKVALDGGAKSTVDSLRMPLFMNFGITVPPADEQGAIVSFIEIETAKFDALTAEAQRGIELLKERRSALISAAVTGKIDVRGKM